MSRSASLLVALVVPLARAPQQAYGANGQPQRPKPTPQPLDKVLMQVFDKDMSSSVSMEEVKMSLGAFAAMGGAMGGQQPGQPPNPMGKAIEWAQKLAPSIFALLDADDSKSLSQKELVWFVKAQKAFQSGALCVLTPASITRQSCPQLNGRVSSAPRRLGACRQWVGSPFVHTALPPRLVRARASRARARRRVTPPAPLRIERGTGAT